MGVVASGLSATPSKYRGKYRGAMSIAGSPKYFLDDLSVGAIRAELLDGFEIRRYVGSVSGLKFWGDQLFAWPSLAQRGHHSHVSPNTPIFGVLLRPIPECLHHCTIAPLGDSSCTNRHMEGGFANPNSAQAWGASASCRQPRNGPAGHVVRPANLGQRLLAMIAALDRLGLRPIFTPRALAWSRPSPARGFACP